MSTVHDPHTGVMAGGNGNIGTVPELDAQVSMPHVFRPRQYMTVSGTRAPVDEGISASGYDYEQFTMLAGPLTHPRRDQPYRVKYRRIDHGIREWLFTRFIVAALVALDLMFIYWLVFESQYPDVSGWMWRGGLRGITTDAHIFLLAFMALGSIIMQLFLLMNVVTVSRSCLAARDPIPVDPDPQLRVAFITTIVPDKEPIAMAERTLRAAKQIVYHGQLDVWLLDEGNSDEVLAMCRRLNIHHFSRKGRGDLEFSSGTFAAKTKHGNHNRWLWEHAHEYDVVMFVDTDHVPLPIMAERLLGYFRDPEATVRYRLLRYAMRRLGGLPHTQVYLDAGNPGMFPDPARLAGPLARAGLRYGRGFSANVSNFQWTPVMVGWSQRLERALGGSVGAVIDTSRNGNGPYTGGQAPQWCNPPGRAPGPAPQLDPGPAGMDAYLWIKNPGVSDGPCNGGPAAGRFWTQYAVGLAQSGWRSRATRDGNRGRRRRIGSHRTPSQHGRADFQCRGVAGARIVVVVRARCCGRRCTVA